MSGLLSFVVKHGADIVKVVKILFQAYQTGHEAGLWQTRPGVPDIEHVIVPAKPKV